ncbi:hypothetical protein FQN54_005048 [Arachnomyces sp. PD_36]|nr:hypothetical protein FQN54_005048 [Arachnomyces sp. PD_36]
MTMVIQNQNRQYGGMGFDNVYQNNIPQNSPQFTDPWTAQSSPNQPPSMYPTAMGSNQMNMAPVKQEDVSRPTAISMPYSNIPVSAPSMVGGTSNSNNSTYSNPPAYGGLDMSSVPQELPRTSFEQGQNYSAVSTMSPFAPTNFTSLNYAQSLQQQQQQQHHHPSPQQQQMQADGRRMSQVNHPASRPPQPPQTQASYGDALDASRGMVALSQDLTTPRNIYGPRSARGSTDSYGFPSAQSSASSISSAGNYPYYSASVASVDSSVTDYSSANSEPYDSHPSRTLPRPPSLLTGNCPPGPQSMMGQFSSKMPSNTQKKHKCKVCDKRFTRPSSLQTHMYSHTGEKRKSTSGIDIIFSLSNLMFLAYACDVEGCGRHFSVVSNLRRHKKVHKGEKDAGSAEDEE